MITAQRERPALICDAVFRTYPGVEPVEALHATSFEVLAGEFVAIVGRSGSGKSTLLNILGLLDRPTGGRVLIGGCDAATLSDGERTRLRRETLGFVFQQFHLLANYSAARNVALALLHRGMRRSERINAALTALERVGLRDRANFLPRQLSGGQQQRVAIARALVGEPQIVICDEPTGNLDRASADQVLELIAGLGSAGTSVLMVTHDTALAQRTDRVLTIDDGYLTTEGHRQQ